MNIVIHWRSRGLDLFSGHLTRVGSWSRMVCKNSEGGRGLFQGTT